MSFEPLFKLELEVLFTLSVGPFLPKCEKYILLCSLENLTVISSLKYVKIGSLLVSE